ncbi:hypothetical protein CXR04_00180 [Streptomyces sp. CMB-StM0423]|nr:hypothetical protein CXR04_00180 [Streptomyces sp. CMB-StM0423]
MEVNTVVDRLKTLSTQGLLPDPDSPTIPRGRHRRTDNSGHLFPGSAPAGQQKVRDVEAARADVPLDPWADWETEFSAHAACPPPMPHVEADPSQGRMLITMVVPKT